MSSIQKQTKNKKTAAPNLFVECRGIKKWGKTFLAVYPVHTEKSLVKNRIQVLFPSRIQYLPSI